jgi:hypothetical protein
VNSGSWETWSIRCPDFATIEPVGLFLDLEGGGHVRVEVAVSDVWVAPWRAKDAWKSQQDALKAAGAAPTRELTIRLTLVRVGDRAPLVDRLDLDFQCT